MQRRLPLRFVPWLAVVALTALFAYRFSSLLANAEHHFVDFAPLHGGQLVFQVPDTRLNAWILAWVDHAAWTRPTALFDANIHHPALNVLAGSEHMIGVSLQLLPFEPFVDGAIARHQLALALSSALLAATSLAAVRWATASWWAASLAAAFALLMPWRVTELAHLQLSSAQWLPLVWAGVMRGMLGEARRRDLFLFGVVLTLQLLSSFYLAYFLTLSCAVLVGTVAAIHRPRWRDLRRLAIASAPGYAVFVLSALPYLRQRAEAQLTSTLDPALSLGLGPALGVIAPRWPWGWELLNAPANYWTPVAVAVLAAIGLAASWRKPAADRTDRTDRQHVFSLGLAAIVVLSVVMMIGGSIEIGGSTWPTPARLLAEVLPGFSALRGPSRWGILAATALPLLAGVGAHAIDTWAGARASARAAVGVASALCFAWFTIPTAPAWNAPDLLAGRYAALRALPPGPLLELPWPKGAGDVEYGSRSVLASTLHWRPLLNGYTGHRPRQYRFLQRIAERLPAERSLTQLHRLTGFRHILLDGRHIPAASRSLWLSAEQAGLLRRVHTSPQTVIYEVVGWESGGDLAGALLDPARRARTFGGLPRSALALSSGALSGDARAGELSATTAARHDSAWFNDARLRIRNDTSQAWPGFDSNPNGLVQLRYSYFPALPDRTDAPDTRDDVDDRREVVTRIAALDTDLPAGSALDVISFLQAPSVRGHYELCMDLIQQVDGRMHALPVRAVRQPVFVRGSRPPADGGKLEALIDRNLLRPAALPACGGADPSANGSAAELSAIGGAADRSANSGGMSRLRMQHTAARE